MQKLHLFDHSFVLLDYFIHQATQFLSLAVLDGFYKLVGKEESEIATVHIGLSVDGL